MCEFISCNNGGATAIETMKYFVENATNNGASSSSMNALYAVAMYPQNSFQNIRANYYMMTAPNSVQDRYENSQFYNQAMMMNRHSASPSFSSGNGMGSSLPDNSAHSNNRNYYSGADNGGGFHRSTAAAISKLQWAHLNRSNEKD